MLAGVKIMFRGREHSGYMPKIDTLAGSKHFTMTLRLVLVFVSMLVFSQDLYAAGDPSECVITIETVALKNGEGKWVTVANPDHEVDLVTQEAGLSFFNNGRVPAGRYVNFRILISKRFKVLDSKSSPVQAHFEDGEEGSSIEIRGAKDFEESFLVNRSSFIGVWFKIDLHGTIQKRGSSVYFAPPHKIEEVTVTIDEHTRTFQNAEIAVSF